MNRIVWAVLLALITAPLGAMTIAYEPTAPNTGGGPGGDGNQPFTGTLGMDFDVLLPITVTHLGVFDDDQDGIIGTTLHAQIWDRNTMSPVSPLAMFTTAAPGTLTGQARFLAIAAFTLNPGQYSILAGGYGPSEQNYNQGNDPGAPPNEANITNTGGGLIAFVGSSRFNSTAAPPLVWPGTADSGPVDRYSAGTFQFQSAVPEPGTVSLLGSGLLLIGLAIRKKVQG